MVQARAMVKAELIALLERLAEQPSQPDAPLLSPAERALLSAHAQQLRQGHDDLQVRSKDRSLAAPQKPKTSAPAPVNTALIDELDHAYQALAQQSARDLTVNLPRFIEALETADLNKADTLALAERILPAGSARHRSRTQALGAIKGRLMQRFRDAVRTAKLGDRG